MKRIAYFSLHYGKEYLDAAIRAIDPLMDEIYIFYSAKPSQGQRPTGLICPDTKNELYGIAKFASSKINWLEGSWTFENQHRAEIMKYAGKDDTVLAVDADEVWDTEVLEKCLRQAEGLPHREFQIRGYVNFWRSFNYACYDGFLPHRIFRPGNPEGVTQLSGKIYHFGCAQREELMRYKYQVFGHAGEIKKNWLEETYLKWEPGQGNLHCVAENLWNAVPFDKTTLSELLKQHPYYGLDTIP